jgi:ribonuclease HI
MKFAWAQRRETLKSCRTIDANHVQIWGSSDNVLRQYITEYASKWTALRVMSQSKMQRSRYASCREMMTGENLGLAGI